MHHRLLHLRKRRRPSHADRGRWCSATEQQATAWSECAQQAIATPHMALPPCPTCKCGCDSNASQYLWMLPVELPIEWEYSQRMTGRVSPASEKHG